jgi:hypothetical protein
MGAFANYNGIRFFNNSNMVTQVMSVNNISDGLGANNVYVNNSLQAGSSLRAPIFYDSNNTTYYTNPGSTTTSAKIAGNVVIDTNKGFSNTGSWTRFTTGSGYIELGPANSSWAHIYTDRPSFYLNKPLRVSSGSTLNTGDIRSAIYYDINNTVYYTNPASTSNLNGLNVNGNVGIGTTVPGTFLQLGTYAASGKYINQATYPDIPSEHMLHISAPSTANYYGGGISWGETSFTAANIVARDAGTSGALDICFGTGNSAGITEKMRVANNGNVGIGTINPTSKLEVGGNIKALGTIVATSTMSATNFILSSDERLKENIKELEPKKINTNWKSFNLKDSEEDYRVGVIAQELEVTNPEFVVTNDEGFKSVKYIDLLISKIAELEARLEKAGI